MTGCENGQSALSPRYWPFVTGRSRSPAVRASCFSLAARKWSEPSACSHYKVDLLGIKILIEEKACLRYFALMATTPASICFKATLLRPESPKGAAWAFLVLPADASAKLSTRSMTTVDGTLEGHPFQATLEPDGQGSHWLKVGRALREAAGAAVGDTVALEITPVAVEPEPRVPAALRKALAAAPAARAQWSSLSPVARRDWIHWITSAKKAETRERRITNACDMLASGKRRACCFDRSGIYSKALGAPKAAD